MRKPARFALTGAALAAVGFCGLAVASSHSNGHRLGFDEAPIVLEASADAGTPLPPGSHEPDGYARISRRGFDAKEEHGWTDRGDGNFSIVRDAAAPRSAPNIGQARFPAGHPSGSGPIMTSLALSSRPTEIYLSFWVRLSPNWAGNDAGVNKVFFLWMHEQPIVALSAQGAGSARLEPQVRLQATPMGSPVLRPNLVPSAEIVRGRWHRWELVMKANTPGIADGEVHWWIDGRKVARHGQIAFADRRQSNEWSEVSWNPTYGGSGRPVPVEQVMQMDEAYVSGR
jgi:hypothetical protein